MPTVYIFDVDGTLTAPLREINEKFAYTFLKWSAHPDRIVYLATGSDIAKTKRQLFPSFIDQCDGLFTCSGNVFYSKRKLVYKNELEIPPSLIEDLELYLDQGTEWRKKTGNHIEIRSGMINFSTLGRNASPNLRKAYYKWDQRTREREDIVNYITNLYPQLEVSIGGIISVDIYPKGKNKAQVIDTIHELHGSTVPIVFVGDRNVPGGNDWPLAQRLESLDDCYWFQVKSYKETRALIEENELFT
jgi:phosphomannomutase